MKKYLLLIFCTLLFSVSLSAQKDTQHVKLLGIPLNGSITNFQNKLIAKGFKYDSEGSKALDTPTRIYNGLFAGESAQLFVYYNRDQKFVYRTKAIIIRDTKNQIINIMKFFKSQLEEKYSTTATSSNSDDGDGYYITIPNGRIDLYYRQSPYSIGYSLHIDYWDSANTKKNDKSNMNDL